MNWIINYDNEIEKIFEEAASEIGCFPSPLDEMGQTLLAHAHPQQSQGSTNYICYLLPFWLREQTDLPSDLYSDLAIGNIHAMLHFFLLDDAIDAGSGLNGDNLRRSLILGQLVQSLFQQRYHRHFPAVSPIWSYYNRYVTDWAQAVYHEGRPPADPRDSRQLARKSGPVKLCAAGILLLAGKEEWITDWEEAIDLTLATLQLADDWTDWRDDLAAEANCNSFLTLVREQLALEEGLPLEERTVKAAIYRHGCLDRLAAIAETNGQRLKEIPNAPAMLLAFHNSVADGIRKDAQLAEETTSNLALGGFSHFLSLFPGK